MHIKQRTVLALVFVVFSLLYIVFAISLEQNRMIGDQEGWDPGSRAVPLGLGLLMLALSASIFLRERRAPVEESADEPDAGGRRLVVLAIVVSLLYVLLFRLFGFVLLTVALIFTLSFFSRRGDLMAADVPVFGVGLLSAEAMTLVVYTAGHIAIRWLFYFSRQLSIPFLGSSLFRSLVALLIAAGLVAVGLAASQGMKASERWHDVRTAAVLATATTEVMYLVFKQIFLVDLVGGLVSW